MYDPYFFLYYDPYTTTEVVIDTIPVQFKTRFVLTDDEESDEAFTYKHLTFKSYGDWGYYKTLVVDKRTNTVMYTYRGDITQEKFIATFKMGYFRCAAIREKVDEAEYQYNKCDYRLHSIPCCHCYDSCNCDYVYRDARVQVAAARQELERLRAELAVARKERAVLKKARKGK